ncbi:hypothetical protein NSQ54_17420 [Alkalihalobacillus sp. FSL W8-0930]
MRCVEENLHGSGLARRTGVGARRTAEVPRTEEPYQEERGIYQEDPLT